jgi:hypothetical protein
MKINKKLIKWIDIVIMMKINKKLINDRRNDENK